MSLPLLLYGAQAGFVGTLLMDSVGARLRARGFIGGLPLDAFAKWFACAARGRILHKDLALATVAPWPPAHTMAAHHAIGIVLGVASAFVVPGSLCPFTAAIVYGLATSVLSLFFMFPAMGLGMLGRRGPRDRLLLRTSLVNHLVYGVGLGAVWLLLLLVV